MNYKNSYNLLFLFTLYFIVSCNDIEIRVMQEQLNQQTERVSHQTSVMYFKFEKTYAENPTSSKQIYELAREVQLLAKDLNLSIKDIVLGFEIKQEIFIKQINRIQEINKTAAENHQSFLVPESDPTALYQELFSGNKKAQQHKSLKLALIRSFVNHWEFEFIKNLQKILPKTNFMTTRPVLLTQVNKTELQLGEPFKADFFYLSVLINDSKFMIGDFDTATFKFRGQQEILQMNNGFGAYSYIPTRKGKNQIQGAILKVAPDGSERLYPFISKELIVE